MKNHTFNAASIPMLLAALLVMLTGCGTTKEPSNVAVLALNGANNPTLSVATIQEELESTIYNGGTISFCQADGDPSVFSLKLNAIKKSDDYNYATALNTIQNYVLNMAADDEETDLIAGFRRAGRSLQADGGKGTLLVAHSGLSTSGVQMQALDLTDAASIPDLIEALRQQGQLADLSGVDVVWRYCGDVVSPQQSLNENEKAYLRSFWTQYLEACGAASVTFREDLPDSSIVEDAPSVTVVPTEVEALQQPVRLDAASGVGFVADSATEVLDAEAFHTTLCQLTEQIRNSNCRYVLAGSTSDDGSGAASQQRFGLARAEFVRQAIAQLDPDAARQVLAVGLGKAETSVRSAVDGEVNRTVWLVPENSDLGKEFLSVGLME